MIPLETAYRNRVRINEFPMQELHCGIKRINVEGEGNNRCTVDAVLRRRRLGKRVGNDGEICGNLHAPSISQASDSYKVSIDGITKHNETTPAASLWGTRAGVGPGNRAYQTSHHLENRTLQAIGTANTAQLAGW